MTPEATTDGVGSSTGDRCLPLLEVASRIEGQQELLSALVPDKRSIALQEFGNCLGWSGTMATEDGVTVEIRVLDYEVAARRDERSVGMELGQDVVLTMPRVEDNEDGGLAFGATADLTQNLE